MTEDSTPPILGHALDQPPAFTPRNLIDDVRRRRQIPAGMVPPVCILEFDGDIYGLAGSIWRSQALRALGVFSHLAS